MPEAKSVRSVDAGRGMRVDYGADGAPMGIEISAPAAVSAEDVNAVLAGLGVAPMPLEEWAPLRAA